MTADIRLLLADPTVDKVVLPATSTRCILSMNSVPISTTTILFYVKILNTKSGIRESYLLLNKRTIWLRGLRSSLNTVFRNVGLLIKLMSVRLNTH
jgi:hypothetical protein